MKSNVSQRLKRVEGLAEKENEAESKEKFLERARAEARKKIIEEFGGYE
ncbi:MAG: hypothetical protein H8E62_04680 [Planctomycetes bacterium]|nr:hypothetical protein [Planctomycetota bacterium]